MCVLAHATLGDCAVPKITPFLWFDGKALEAAKFYVSVFPNSKITDVARFENAGPRGDETVTVVTFRLDGREFNALDGGPLFRFSPAISFFVPCTTQEEVDGYWRKLSKGGEKQPCGWLKDKYGVSWQIVPTILDRLLRAKDAAKAKRAMDAMLQMTKLDIRKLKRAYDGA
jgi:predicted 3-demethylubiquinone-9 3-methyltransferase (glyoxalase superfamily)